MDETLKQEITTHMQKQFETFDTVESILKQSTQIFDESYQRNCNLRNSISDPLIKRKLIICLESVKNEFEVLLKRLKYYQSYFKEYLKIIVLDLELLHKLSADAMSAKINSKDEKNYKLLLNLCLKISFRIQEYLLKPVFDFFYKFDEISKTYDKTEGVIKSLTLLNQKLIDINHQMEKQHPKFLIDWNKFMDLQPVIKQFSNDYNASSAKS
jgi:hypothetical protein